MMANLYRNSPQSGDKKRKLETPAEIKNKRPKFKERVLYPSPHVLSRNLNSPGLLGPRRNSSDKYFMDRMGTNKPPEVTKVSTRQVSDNTTPNKGSRDGNIQRFMGNLPSRTSFASFLSPERDPRQNLYRVHLEKYPWHSEHCIGSESGITPDNSGVSVDPPASPTSSDQTDTTVVTGNVFFQKDEDANEYKQDGYSVKYSRNRADKGKKVAEKESIDVTKKSQSHSGEMTSMGKEKSPKKRLKAGNKLRKANVGDELSADKTPGPDIQRSTVTFADVGGNEENLKEICKLLVHMRHPEVYRQLGVTPPRGFLLHGPPGCGKTLLANAIAGELDLAFIKLAATELVSGVSGESESKIRELFEKAVDCAPCVLFIDEIDAITPKRETASKEMEIRIVAQLLACMDDLNANPDTHVLVIGATNRADSLDPALRRAGRFDREICLGIPDEPSRLRILRVLCRTLRLAADFDFAYVAHNSPGFVGADLMSLTREAAMTAVNRVFNDLQSSHTEEIMEIHKPVPSSSVTELKNIVTETSNQSTLIQTDCDTNKDSKLTTTDHNMDNQSTSCDTDIGANLLTWVQKQKARSKDERGNRQCSKENMHSSPKGDIPLTEEAPCNMSDKTVTSGTGVSNGQDQSQEAQITETRKAETANISNTGEVESGTSLNVDNQPSDSLSDTACVNNQTDNFMSDNTVTNKHSDKNIERNKECESSGDQQVVSDMNAASSDKDGVLLSLLSWLKEYPPLTQEQLSDLYITFDDFKEALGHVQPSAKREGFATIPGVTWDDVGALHEVREELQLAILAPVRHPEQFKSLGLTRAQGILLAGPPGCGKTLLAKAVANESGINFISVKGPELLNMYVGESEKAVRTVFQRARNSAPCVIFFDELDALCPRRSHSGESGSSSRVVNQLLTEMDGLEERKQVFIMAATNRPDIIDPAVLRPGRLDKTLYVGLPDARDRLDILTCITKNGTKPLLHDDVVLAEIAEHSHCDRYTSRSPEMEEGGVQWEGINGSSVVLKFGGPRIMKCRDIDEAKTLSYFSHTHRVSTLPEDVVEATPEEGVITLEGGGITLECDGISRPGNPTTLQSLSVITPSSGVASTTSSGNIETRGADLAAIVREASVSALKVAISGRGSQSTGPIAVRRRDFETAFQKIRPSVSDEDLLIYRHMKTNISV